MNDTFYKLHAFTIKTSTGIPINVIHSIKQLHYSYHKTREQDKKEYKIYLTNADILPMFKHILQENRSFELARLVNQLICL